MNPIHFQAIWLKRIYLMHGAWLKGKQNSCELPAESDRTRIQWSLSIEHHVIQSIAIQQWSTVCDAYLLFNKLEKWSASKGISESSSLWNPRVFGTAFGICRPDSTWTSSLYRNPWEIHTRHFTMYKNQAPQLFKIGGKPFLLSLKKDRAI